ncbi:MAG: hypothetical protein ACE5NG_12865, partial [bacterium]
MATLTGGVFLVAFALKLGASNTTIGLLAAIPPLAQLIKIPSIYVVEKIRNRRAITVYASASSKIFCLATGLRIPIGLATGFYIDYWEKLFPDYLEERKTRTFY